MTTPAPTTPAKIGFLFLVAAFVAAAFILRFLFLDAIPLSVFAIPLAVFLAMAWVHYLIYHTATVVGFVTAMSILTAARKDAAAVKAETEAAIQTEVAKLESEFAKFTAGVGRAKKDVEVAAGAVSADVKAAQSLAGTAESDVKKVEAVVAAPTIKI